MGTVRGSADTQGRNFGLHNSASWTLMESPDTRSGVAAAMQCAVIVRRRALQEPLACYGASHCGGQPSNCGTRMNSRAFQPASQGRSNRLRSQAPSHQQASGYTMRRHGQDWAASS
ncbi:hypothetical protein CCMA1212_001416 [Trichoderma ghanense]|uniref:Uncharacterized protein n=1 Tax=Trichoderma ghanense TaxID=65468 RepID=A0ABY2HBC9_9HYPO